MPIQQALNVKQDKEKKKSGENSVLNTRIPGMKVQASSPLKQDESMMMNVSNVILSRCLTSIYLKVNISGWHSNVKNNV